MNARTTVSAKGQVVIPKDVRERLRFVAGDKLDVVERPDGVLLRRAGHQKSGRTTEEILAEMKALVDYRGPPVAVDDMDRALAEWWARGGPDADR